MCILDGMREFEIEKLNDKSYGELEIISNLLSKGLRLGPKTKEVHRVNGKLTLAAKVEMELILMSKNMGKVKLVMTAKESDALESFVFGLEPYSKN